MWWNDPRCIHVHIPKTGGNSITAALYSAWSRRSRAERIARRVRMAGRRPAAIHRFHKHAKARDIHATVGEHAWRGRLSFAVVRNPWDLMVSSYHWWLKQAERGTSFRLKSREVAAFGSFPRFMESSYGRDQINEQVGTLRDWLCDNDGRILVDVVCRFERLEHEWHSIADMLGVQATLPHLNRGNRGAYQQYYDSSSKQIVAERFAWSIDHFGYRF